MKIVLLDDFFFANGIVDTTFYIEVGEKPFPGEDWTDYTVIVLRWWVDALLKVYSLKTADFKLNFMDGPFYIECKKNRRKCTSVFCFK